MAWAEWGEPRRNAALLAQVLTAEAAAGGAASAAAAASLLRQLGASAASATALVVDRTADGEDVAEPAAKKARLSDVAAPVHGGAGVPVTTLPVADGGGGGGGGGGGERDLAAELRWGAGALRGRS